MSVTPDQILELADRCEAIMPLVGTKMGFSTRRGITESFLKQHATDMLVAIRASVYMPPAERKPFIIQALLAWQDVAPLTVDDPGWRAVYFLGLAVENMVDAPSVAAHDVRRVESYLGKVSA